MDDLQNLSMGQPQQFNPQNMPGPNMSNLGMMPPPWWWAMYGQNPMTMGPNGNMPNMNNRQNQQVNNTVQQKEQNVKPSIPCGIISEVSEIKPQMVPENGSIEMFIMKDLSGIYLKQWGSDGKVTTKVYRMSNEEIPPVETTTVDPMFQNILNMMNERFERIENVISDLSQETQETRTRKVTNGQKNQKMEVSTNG